jgi:hypothetical protein
MMIVTRATVIALHTFTCWTNLVYPTRRDWLPVGRFEPIPGNEANLSDSPLRSLRVHRRFGMGGSRPDPPVE